MARTFCFDESESLDELLARYRRGAEKAGLSAAELLAGESTVRTFHRALSESLELGNQAHFEKLIGKNAAILRVVALPRRQRGIFSRLIARLTGR